jgi:hypothetical protein
MAINFIINKLERTLPDGGVYTIHWSAYKIVNNVRAGSYGSIGITPDPQSPDFIPYENITEENVIGWLNTALGEEKLAQMEEAYDAQIAERSNPTKAEGLPWQ